ncbi:MAG: phosphoenolpyruvate carboxykinase (ATP) [Oscillospiraceae bacterium]|nr:phosphoenolpyruvate carboxykinase (ATP) [Oscillospiraceae bacterium]
MARLTTEDAIFHYLSGYTSKVSGTECGISRPLATFSCMFGAPFFPLKTEEYTALMAKKLNETGARVYLVNTGWCGGRAGEVSRIKLSITRALVNAAINGSLENVDYTRDEMFHLNVPGSCPGVDPQLLDPEKCWTDKDRYLEEREALAALFRKSEE